MIFRVPVVINNLSSKNTLKKMKRHNLSVIILLSSLLVFVACNDDSLFTSKVSVSGGYTIVSKIRPGGLEMALGLRMRLITKLKINDTIDSRDFKTMRDEMPNLQVLDLSNAVIAAYNGYEGTGFNSVYRYSANSIPEFAFYNQKTSVGKTGLQTIILPNTIRSIRDYAFNMSGISGELIIPASVKDTIGKSAFSFCENLTGLTLSGAKLIGESAFQGCVNLSGNLVFPDSVITIHPWAFANCEKISTIEIPESLTEIGISAFNACGGLFNVSATNLNFSSAGGVLFNADKSTLIQFPKSKSGVYNVPATVSSIGPWAFANNDKLTGIQLPPATAVIEDYAFYNCVSLSGNFPIPSSMWYIGQQVFEGCLSISGFTVAADNMIFTYTNGVLNDISQFTLKRCIPSKSGSFIVDANILFIDNSAFSNCLQINSITFPEGLLDISKRAFFNCSGLTNIYIKNPVPIDLISALSAFEGVDKANCTLHVPLGTKTAYSNAIGWKDFVNIVEN